jgi:taurine dioxygenase
MTTMGYSLSPLPGQSEFGVVVTGFQPEMLDDAGVRKDLYDLWIDKGVIVFRELAGHATHIRLSEVFGEPEEHPLLRGITDQPRESKLIVDIEFDGKMGSLYEVDGELRGSWLPWHSDSVYTDSINHGGILWSITVPERGGETGFIDQIAAYDSLPEELKQRIEGLNVLYRYDVDSSKMKFGKGADRCVYLDPFITRTNQHATTAQRSIHPLVYTQKETERKVLNISPWFADAIEGMETPEGDALLAEVIDRATREERAYYHHWVPGEMVLWDNWRMMHCAAGVPVGMKRHMRRTTIAGDYALGRREATEAAA